MTIENVKLEDSKKYGVRKLEGAPDDSELSIRLTYSRDYKPGKEGYENIHTMLGKLLYDKECIDEQYYDLNEAMDLGNEGMIVMYELVDEFGQVWSEYYELES